MDTHQLFEVISDVSRDGRKEYHVTLGEMLKILSDVPLKDVTVPVVVTEIDGGTIGSVGRPHSYRGYYVDLAFDHVREEPRTVEQFLDTCRSALGGTFIGWKGGEFTMDEDTPLWVAEVGSTGYAILGAFLDDGEFCLMCKKVGED